MPWCFVDDLFVFECFPCFPCLCVPLVVDEPATVPAVPVDAVVGVPEVPEPWPFPRATALTHWPWFWVLPLVAVPDVVAVFVVVAVPLPALPCGQVCAAWLTTAPWLAG